MQPVRRMSTTALVGVCAMVALTVTLTWFVLLPSPVLGSIERATSHLVQPTLVLTATTAALVALIAQPTLYDVGLDRGLVRGIIVLLTGYVAIQVGLALAAGELVRGRALTMPSGVVVGSVVAQLFGTALVEESVFRGLLFRQLTLRMHVVPAAVLSAFLFAVWHVPQRQSLGLAGLDLVGSIAIVWLGGLFAAWFYVRTGNLYIVIALHALFNEGAPLIESPVTHQVILAFYTAALIVWTERARSHRDRNTRNTGTRHSVPVQPK